VLGDIQVPTLIVHGTEDTFIPVDSSRWAVQRLTAEHRLIEVDGAQRYANPQSQAEVIRAVADWTT
jgi:hypothetical protein